MNKLTDKERLDRQFGRHKNAHEDARRRIGPAATNYGPSSSYTPATDYAPDCTPSDSGGGGDSGGGCGGGD